MFAHRDHDGAGRLVRVIKEALAAALRRRLMLMPYGLAIGGVLSAPAHDQPMMFGACAFV